MKNIKYFICVLAISFIVVDEYLAQQSNKDQIVVIGTASVEIPADIVILKITLSFVDKVDGRKAYELHKQAERKLIELLNKMEIPDSTVTFSLLTINSYNDTYYRSEDSIRKIYTSNQLVEITLYDLSKYTSVQLDLISNGFTTVSASFGSRKETEGIGMAVQKAVEQAKLKAEIIANESNRKIKKISKIMDTEETEPVIQSFYYEKGWTWAGTMNVMGGRVNQLIDIPQNIKLTKQVKMILELHDVGLK